MAINKSNFDEIIRDYERKQTEYRHKKERLMEKITKEYPRLIEIDQEISTLSVATAKALLLEGENDSLRIYKDKLAKLREEKQSILDSANFEEIEYYCNDCKDTGYLENGHKCHCFKQQELNILYSQSNIKNIIATENFDNFSYNYYSKDFIDAATGRSAYANIQNAVSVCKDFINNFEENKGNLFLYGATGVGKTFLSNCIAKELLDSYHSVIYLSAIQLFDLLAGESFSKNSNTGFTEDIINCDLLIIDDLGTELKNSFTISALFNCLNERLLRRNSTIISSNLSLEQLQNEYNDRLFSRILGNYKILKIYGEDIRFLKRN